VAAQGIQGLAVQEDLLVPVDSAAHRGRKEASFQSRGLKFPASTSSASEWGRFSSSLRQTADIYGLRVNVGYGTNEEVWGLDLGTINSAARFYGIQLGGWNKIGKIIGLQAGLVNSTTSTYRSQLGGWNYTERIAGLQVGLFIVKSIKNRTL